MPQEGFCIIVFSVVDGIITQTWVSCNCGNNFSSTLNKNPSSLHYPQAVKPVNAVGLFGVFLKDWTQSCLSQITLKKEMIAPCKHKKRDVLTSFITSNFAEVLCLIVYGGLYIFFTFMNLSLSISDLNLKWGNKDVGRKKKKDFFYCNYFILCLRFHWERQY